MSEPGSRPPDDPSMDEILASIRRIVFEQDGKARPGPAGDAARAAPAAGSSDPAPGDAGPAERAEDAGADGADAAPDAAPEVPAGGAGPGGAGSGGDDAVLLLTEMIAADGSVVRIDPGTAREPGGWPAASAGTAFDPPARQEVAVIVDRWLDRHMAGIVNQAVRDAVAGAVERELRQQAGERGPGAAEEDSPR